MRPGPFGLLLILPVVVTGCATSTMTVAEAHSKAIAETRWEGELDDAPLWSNDPKKSTIFGEIASKFRAH